MRAITPKMSTLIRETLLFQRYINPLETPVTKKQAINARVRHKVTTCLYLKRSYGARSLSTLIVVEVKTDIPHKIRSKAGNDESFVQVPIVHLGYSRHNCSNCAQKLDERSLARARKIFARAHMLGFSLKFPAV